MKLYLAGPMTGHPQFNFPLFDTVARLLRDQGHEIWSPAELDRPEVRKAALKSDDGAPGTGVPEGASETWGDFLSRDVKIVADDVEGVAVLPEWWTSKGARLEAYCAHLTGKPIYYATDLLLGVEVTPIFKVYVERGCHGYIPHGVQGELYETLDDLKRRLKEPAYA